MSTPVHDADAIPHLPANAGAVAAWLDAKETLGMLLAAISMCSEDQLRTWVDRHGDLGDGVSMRYLACALAEAKYAPKGKNGKPKGLTALYRMFDEDGLLLYIGITARPGDRWDYHRRGAYWWPRVSQITVEHFTTRSEAVVAELAAIAAEQPHFNVAGQQPGYPPHS